MEISLRENEIKQKVNEEINKFIEEQKLEEGLITTYPIEKTVSVAKNKFNLTDDNVFIEPFENNGIETYKVSILVPISIDKTTLGNIKHFFESCGYFMSKKKMYEEHKTIAMSFEPKYAKDISQHLKKNFKYLFHTTPNVYVDKICKNGLIPYFRNDEYVYPNRIYFMVGNTLNDVQLRVLFKVQVERIKKTMNIPQTNEDNRFSLITIELDKIPNDVKIYSDPNTPFGVYTHDNIPPSCICDISDFNLTKYFK